MAQTRSQTRAQIAAQKGQKGHNLSKDQDPQKGTPARRHPGPPASVHRKRAIADIHDLEPPTKRLRIPGPSAEDIRFWTREGHWSRQYGEPDMEHLLARKRSLSSLRRKRSDSAMSTASSDQTSAQYRDPRYEALLSTKGCFMFASPHGVTDATKTALRSMLEKRQPVPQDSLFRDGIFNATCLMIHNKNEARIVQDISRLIVPSAETLAVCGAEHLMILTESVNEGWNNSVPLTEPRPQPDYSVGFRRDAFTDNHLTKLSPFIGDYIASDQSFFMGTWYMYFPFLACEVKSSNVSLLVADCQNAHSMTLAARGIVELFRLVGREHELHREVLAFSVSHNHQSVQIYGYYPIIDGKNTKYYRHTIRIFDFTEMDGKEKWTAYQFTRNIYDTWVPKHFKRICSAVDQIPSDLAVAALSGSTGLSQSVEDHHLASEASSAPQPADEVATLETSFSKPGPTTKRRKR